LAQRDVGIGGWLSFYNDERPHQTLAYRTPRAVFETTAACGYMDNALVALRSTAALPTYPQEQHQKEVLTKYSRHTMLSLRLPLGSGGALEIGGTLS